MTQPVLPVDKTFRLVVRLVSTDGIELPFKGFALVPEDALVAFENVAKAARYVADVAADVNRPLHLKPAVTTLGVRMSELEKVWDIPK